MLDRRIFLALAVIAMTALSFVAGGGVLASEASIHGAPGVSADEALQRLMEGNKRFQRDEATMVHRTREWRQGLIQEQHPIASVLGCCDSRVPVEILFDQGVGDLFVLRVAGNVVDNDMIGSVEYAFEHLQTALFMVLGHERCGAVKAAIEHRVKNTRDLAEIDGLLSLIDPSLNTVNLTESPDETWHKAVEANVRHSLDVLSSVGPIREAVSARRIKLVGGIYELETGNVRLLK